MGRNVPPLPEPMKMNIEDDRDTFAWILIISFPVLVILLTVILLVALGNTM